MISPRDMELLGILQEECAEVIKVISKIRRFGDDSTHNGKMEFTNKELLIMELLDTAIVIEKLAEYLDKEHDTFSNGQTAEEYYDHKVKKLDSFMTHKS